MLLEFAYYLKRLLMIWGGNKKKSILRLAKKEEL